MKDKKTEKLNEISDKLSDLSEDLINANTVISTNLTDIEKLKQSYFTGGTGIIISDNRPYGMDTIDISVDTTQLRQPRLDLLEQQIIELQETNKILAKYIFDSQK